MARLFWGCDIAGEKKTGLASVRQVNGVWQVYTPSAADKSPLEITRLIWQDAQEHSGFSVVYLVIDAPLSQNLGCPASWRPVDRYSQRKSTANWTMPPNALWGHRGRELAESFGAYFVVAETNPRPCMSLMGADKELLSKYKEEGREGREACNGLSRWLTGALGFGTWETDDNNALDATVCAAVAAAMAGVEFNGLELIAPILGNAEDRKLARLENPQQCIPSAVLVGTAPFLYLQKKTDGNDSESKPSGIMPGPNPQGIPAVLHIRDLGGVHTAHNEWLAAYVKRQQVFLVTQDELAQHIALTPAEAPGMWCADPTTTRLFRDRGGQGRLSGNNCMSIQVMIVQRA